MRTYVKNCFPKSIYERSCNLLMNYKAVRVLFFAFNDILNEGLLDFESK